MTKETTGDFVLSELLSIADPLQAEFLKRFFKTGKGQYGEGDVFLGIRVPQTRDVVKNCGKISFSEIQKLLDSEYHEARLAGFLLLVRDFKKAKKDETTKKSIYDFYLVNAKKANNWDLADMSCRDIAGGYLLDKTDRSILYTLAESDNLWEQRIAMVSTWMFIKHNDYDDALKLAEIFFSHKNDLIHKATGWMLREVGKKDRETLTDFLEKHRLKLPRTMLRYAIEHYSPEKREYFMKKN